MQLRSRARPRARPHLHPRPRASISRTGLVCVLAIGLVAGRTLAAQRVVDLPSPDRALDVRFENVYRIGGSGADGWSAFDVVQEVAFDAAGNLFIVDRRGARIAVVDRQGRLLREIGRRGQGPGEFSLPDGLAVDRDGAFVIHDPLQNMFHRFGPGGTFLRADRTDLDGGTPGRVLPAPGDAVYASPRVYIVNGERSITTGATTMGPQATYPIYGITLASGGAMTERVVHRAWLPPHVRPAAPFASHAFAPRVHWSALSDGRLVVVDSTDYAIDVISPEGARLAVWRRPIAARRVENTDRDHARSLRRAQLIGPDGRPRIAGASAGPPASSAPLPTPLERAERALDAMTFADVIPAIESLAVDWDDRLWVRRAPARAGQSGAIDLLGAAGTYIGTIPPGAIEVPAAFGPDDLVAYIEQDDLDAVVIVVRRLRVTQRVGVGVGVGVSKSYSHSPLPLLSPPVAPHWDPAPPPASPAPARPRPQ